MSIEVEFFGIPRLRAGRDRVQLKLPATATTLEHVLAALRDACPDFAAACLDGNRLRDGYLASINGDGFANGDACVPCGTSVLILSTDAGG